ncbi:hypothetical protein ACHAP5_012282, partial [Fusarium lateritium]
MSANMESYQPAIENKTPPQSITHTREQLEATEDLFRQTLYKVIQQQKIGLNSHKDDGDDLEFFRFFLVTMIAISVFGASTFAVIMGEMSDPADIWESPTFTLKTVRLFLAISWFAFAMSIALAGYSGSALALMRQSEKGEVVNEETIKKWTPAGLVVSVALHLLIVTGFFFMSLSLVAYVGSFGWAPGMPVTRRSTALHATAADKAQPEDLTSLVRTASAISSYASRYRRESQDHIFELPTIQRPRAVKPGRESTIREVPSTLTTPVTTRPSSPVLESAPSDSELPSGMQTPAKHEIGVGQIYSDVGIIALIRGAMILLCTCGVQLMDNLFMTGVNIALPAIQKEFDVSNGDLQWLSSAYTLTFGGFLLLSGVLADRYGRKLAFCSGMLVLSVWTLANALSTSFIQVAIFRTLQGVGAAVTVPSAVGIISNYFVARDRTTALTIFEASRAVGFCLGLIFGGFLTSSLGWRYIFDIPMCVMSTLGILGWFVLPNDRVDPLARPKLDFAGAGLSTAGLILLSFVLSSGSEYGWSKPFIIVLLVLSISMIALFAYVEKK